MSRYTLPIGLPTEAAHIAYGFDHILGPFFDLIIDDQLAEELSYFFNRTFDCHALAFQLIALVDAGAIPDILRTRQHIRRLVLDLPI